MHELYDAILLFLENPEQLDLISDLLVRRAAPKAARELFSWTIKRIKARRESDEPKDQ